MPNIIHAPFSYAQIAALTVYQGMKGVHEMTCLKCNDSVLVPKRDGMGLSCTKCGHIQTWAPFAVFAIAGLYDIPEKL